jgi:hypothetical protein
MNRSTNLLFIVVIISRVIFDDSHLIVGILELIALIKTQSINGTVMMHPEKKIMNPYSYISCSENHREAGANLSSFNTALHIKLSSIHSVVTILGILWRLYI